MSSAAAVDVSSSSSLGRAWEAAIANLRERMQSSDRSGPFATALVAPLRDEPRFAWLLEIYALDDLEAACLVAAIAAEFDRDIARAFARFRGGEPARKHPDCGALKALLCADFDEALALQARLAWDAPLFRHRLLQIAESTTRDLNPLQASGLVADPQIVRTLSYGEWLDPRLARYCRLLAPQSFEGPAALEASALSSIGDVLLAAMLERAPLHLVFQGMYGSGRRTTAHRLASQAGVKLLVADLLYAQALGEFAELTSPLLREAWLQGAWLYLEGTETLLDSPTPDTQRLLEDLADDGGICILETTQPLQFGGRRPLAPLTIDFDTSSVPIARNTWRAALAAGADLADHELDLLAGRYHLPPARIHAAATHAAHLARLRGGIRARPEISDLIRASRGQGPAGLAKLARKIEPAHRWDDLVLPEDATLQLRELCARVEQAIRVFDDWGFGPQMSLGKGTSALFAGASGTGKTMAADVIAAELGLDLYKIDLACLVSKYIGETEKNLDRVFTAARHANAILFFDEADALFGKRSEVRDAHDRYANLEIAYLLQKMEEYDGLSILSTNLKQNIDDAFLRRLTYTVLFPFPAVTEREAIWRKTCPPDLPLDETVDLAALAGAFKLSGGNIRNALLAAAFFAAADDAPVGMRHLVHGVRRELQKAGKTIGELDLATLEPLPGNVSELRYG